MRLEKIIALLILPIGCILFSAEITYAQQAKQLDNGLVELSVNTIGGAYSDFHYLKNPLNPLSWKLTEKSMPANNRSGAPFVGQFLCLGRWGSPSEGEMKAGVPHNGEPSRDKWAVIASDKLRLNMFCKAPLDGLTISRKVELDAKAPVWKVEEKVTNVFSLGRVYNIVQHATLGPPFLDKSTIVNSNAGEGFLQEYSYPDPYKLSYMWPYGIRDTSKTPLNLESTANDFNYVSTHIFRNADKYGWITAASPDKRLLIGYLWKTSEYPWLNVWQYSDMGNPKAKGLEFGTAGIGKSYKDLLEIDTRFHGRNSFEYIDAGEVKSKNFICFLLEIPKGFKKMENIVLENNSIIFTMDNGQRITQTLKSSMPLF